MVNLDDLARGQDDLARERGLARLAEHCERGKEGPPERPRRGVGQDLSDPERLRAISCTLVDSSQRTRRNTDHLFATAQRCVNQASSLEVVIAGQCGFQTPAANEIRSLFESFLIEIHYGVIQMISEGLRWKELKQVLARQVLIQLEFRRFLGRGAGRTI